jgi:hypothetical protein
MMNRNPGKHSWIVLTVVGLMIGGWAGVMIAQIDVTEVFEIDGDIADDPADAADDLVNLNCPSIDAASALINTGVVTDPPGASIFTQGGSKDHADVSDWMYKDGAVPDKDDIRHAYAAQYAATGPGGPTTVLVVGGDRFANDGSAFIGAWFFQNAVGLGAASGQAKPFTGVHENGDILILSEFTQGGVVSTPKVFMWVGSAGDCPAGPCPAATEKGGTLADVTPAPGDVLVAAGLANATDQTILAECSGDWAYTPKQGTAGTLPPNSVFEVAIDLGVLNLGNVCFASFLLETRSSHDVDAVLKDFVVHAFAPCSIDCSKIVSPEAICQGASATYTYAAINDGAADLDFTAVDDNATPGDASDDFCVAFPATDGAPCGTSAPPCAPFTLAAGGTKTCTRTVSPGPGTYTNTLTVTARPAGGTLEFVCDASATLEVNPNPAVTISTFTCEQSPTFTLQALPSGGTAPYGFLWSTGDTTQSITQSTTGPYSVTITDSKRCTAAASRTVGFCAP